MTLPPYLLPHELEQMTRRQRPSAQARQLAAMGIRHYVRGGTVVVFRSDALGDEREPHPWYGLLRPIDWWQDNRAKLLLSLDAMKASAQAWKPSAPHECGVYFFFHAGELQYIGKAKSLANRFSQHASRATVPVDAAGWILCPEQFVTRLEFDYWTAYKPPYNFRMPQ